MANNKCYRVVEFYSGIGGMNFAMKGIFSCKKLFLNKYFARLWNNLIYRSLIFSNSAKSFILFLIWPLHLFSKVLTYRTILSLQWSWMMLPMKFTDITFQTTTYCRRTSRYFTYKLWLCDIFQTYLVMHSDVCFSMQCLFATNKCSKSKSWISSVLGISCSFS